MAHTNANTEVNTLCKGYISYRYINNNTDYVEDYYRVLPNGQVQYSAGTKRYHSSFTRNNWVNVASLPEKAEFCGNYYQ